MSDQPPPGNQRASTPTSRRVASLLVGAALMTALAVIVVSAIRQARQVADTTVLTAPTPPPMAATLPANPAPAAGARQRVQGPHPSIPPSLPVPPVGTGQGTTLAGPPGAASGVVDAPPAGRPSAPPRPTPTPELAASFSCRRGITFDVKPGSTLVTINGEPVGEVSQWEDEDEALMLRRPGVYYVRLSCAGCPTRWFKVTVDPNAEDAVVEIRVRTND